MAPDRPPDPLAVVLEVTALFERLDIPYLTAGSLASSIHGEPRSTVDIDFVAGRDAFDAERQWRDVLGVLLVQGARLDRARLDTWAERLGVGDLLDRALREARGG